MADGSVSRSKAQDVTLLNAKKTQVHRMDASYLPPEILSLMCDDIVNEDTGELESCEWNNVKKVTVSYDNGTEWVFERDED